MGPLTGVVAGIVTIGGAVAAYRFISRKSEDVRKALEEFKRQAGMTGNDLDGAVLDYERDPGDGVFRQKD